MDRVFTKLSDRENEIAQLYGGGLEVKEVANLLFRSSATIRNHMQSIYEKLQVRNRSELSIKMMERLNRVKFTLDLSPIVRASVSCFLLCVFSLSLYHEQSEMRRGREAKVERIERIRRPE